MPNLVNTQTGKVENVSHDDMPGLLQAGSHDLPQNDTVDVLNPAGDLVSVPAQQTYDAINKYGYRFPSSAHVQDFNDQKQYGEGIGNITGAFAAGAARGASFGLSDQALTKSGAINPETLAKLQKHNPAASFLGELTGIGGSMLAMPGASLVGKTAQAGSAITKGVGSIAETAAKFLANPETAPLAAKALQTAGSAAARFSGSAIEGAAYGLGQSVSEDALGDPQAMGDHLIANVGMSALIGGGIGAALGIVMPHAKVAKAKALGPDIEAQGYSSQIGKDAEKFAATKETPQSFEDIRNAVNSSDLKYLPKTELPAKTTLLEAYEANPDLTLKPHALQVQSLENHSVRDVYKTFLEDASEEAKIMQNYEALQKQEAVSKLNKTIQDLAPNKTLAHDPLEAGKNLINDFTEHYNAEKKELAPLFKQFDDTAAASVTDRQGLIGKIEEALPNASQFMKPTAEGIELAKYSPDMPFSKTAYNAIKDVVGVANKKEGLTIGGVRNLRETLRDRVDFMSAPRIAQEVSTLRKSLMDFIQDKVQEITPDMKVRDAFKRYAINEEKRATMEKIMGGSISDKATFAKTITPEDALNKVFGDSVSVDAAKSILGHKFNEHLGSYLNTQMAKVSDAAKNGFSSAKFATFLKGKAPELTTALSDNPTAFNRMRQLTDIMRILPDSPSVNPSGTAKTMSKYLGLAMKLTHPGEAVGEIVEHFKGSLKEGRNKKVIEAILAGQDPSKLGLEAEHTMVKTQALGNLERIKNKAMGAIDSGASKVLNFGDKYPEVIGGYLGSKLSPKEQKDKFKKETTQLNELNNNPQRLLDTLDESTRPLYAVAPNVSGAVAATAARAVQFLQSKVPVLEQFSPLSPKPEPSQTEIAHFERYQQVVNDPLSTFAMVKSGSITPQAIETLQTVYPQLYSQMQQTMMEKIIDHTANDKFIPYRTKMALSMFLQKDLDASLQQTSIASNQTALAGIAAKNEAEQNSMPKTNAKGLGKIDVADRLQTNEQASRDRA